MPTGTIDEQEIDELCSLEQQNAGGMAYGDLPKMVFVYHEQVIPVRIAIDGEPLLSLDPRTAHSRYVPMMVGNRLSDTVAVPASDQESPRKINVLFVGKKIFVKKFICLGPRLMRYLHGFQRRTSEHD